MRATAKPRKMGTRKVLTVDEVVEKLQYSDSDDGMSENDDSEDDFDGYLEEMEMAGGRIKERWTAIVMRTVVMIGVTVMKISTTVMKKWKRMCHQYPRMA